MVDKKNMKHITFVPEDRLEEYPKEEGMLIYSNDFNEVAEELRNIGVCIHEGLSNINLKMAAFEGTLKSLQDQVNDLHSGESEYKISLSANPTSIPGDGKSTSKITATVTDNGGRPVAGAMVTFATNTGLIKPTSVKTTANGKAVTELRSITTYPPSELIANPKLLKVASSNFLTLASWGNFLPRVEKIDIGNVETVLQPPVIGITSTRATVTATCDKAIASIVVAFKTEQKPPVARPPIVKPPVARPPIVKPPVARPPIVKPPVARPPIVKPPTVRSSAVRSSAVRSSTTPKTPTTVKVKPSVTPLRSRKIVSTKRK